MIFFQQSFSMVFQVCPLFSSPIDSIRTCACNVFFIVLPHACLIHPHFRVRITLPMDCCFVPLRVLLAIYSCGSFQCIYLRRTVACIFYNVMLQVTVPFSNSALIFVLKILILLCAIPNRAFGVKDTPDFVDTIFSVFVWSRFFFDHALIFARLFVSRLYSPISFMGRSWLLLILTTCVLLLLIYFRDRSDSRFSLAWTCLWERTQTDIIFKLMNLKFWVEFL